MNSFHWCARRSVKRARGWRSWTRDFQFSRLLRCFNQLNDFEKLGTVCAPTKLAGQRLKAAESAAGPRRDFSLSLASPARTRRHQRAHTGVERAFTSSVQSPPPYQEGHRPVLR